MRTDTPAYAYVMRVRQEWPINPIEPSGVIMFDNVWVEIRPDFEPEEVHLSSIFTLDAPGHGWASKALDWLLDLADEMNVKITGYIKPFGRQKRFTAKQLWKWEQRHGFVRARGEGRGYVVYHPGSRKRALGCWC